MHSPNTDPFDRNADSSPLYGPVWIERDDFDFDHALEDASLHRELDEMVAEIIEHELTDHSAHVRDAETAFHRADHCAHVRAYDAATDIPF